MLSRPLLLLLRGSRTLWIRVLIIALLTLAALILAPLLEPLIGENLKSRFSEDAVLPVLKILASGMLAVTTFSLNVMVTSFQSAAGQTTPRAYRLLMQDTTTQNVLATYVGSFLFSLVGLVLVLAGFFSEAGIVVIFAMTSIVIALIILTTVRWIGHLSHLGSMDHTLELVHDAARDSMTTMARAPALGGLPMRPGDRAPEMALTLPASRAGYVQFVDMAPLNALMAKEDGEAWILTMPGTYVVEGQPLVAMRLGAGASAPKAADFFIVGDTRTLEQDARFGLSVMSEIGLRALSPGINDPGTAIDVVHRMQAVLWHAAQMTDPDCEIRFPRVHAPPYSAEALLQDAFGTLAADGAARVEVVRALLESQHLLARCDWDDMRTAARGMSRRIVGQARVRLDVPQDRRAIAQLACAGRR